MIPQSVLIVLFFVFKGWIDPPTVETGRLITDQVGKSLVQTVLREVGKGGVKGGVAFCSEEALPLTDSLARALGVKIQRVAARNRNPKNNLSPEYQEIWHSFDRGESVEKLIEQPDSYLYFRPIKLQATCEMCHGKAIAEDVMAQIKENYPQDQATHFTVGDLRGMWIVRWPK